MIKYFSDKTGKYYSSVDEANKAERELEERERIRKEKEAKEKAEKAEKEKAYAAERKAKAAEVEEARKTMVTAQHKYREVLDAFIKQYGSFHYTSHSFDDIPVLFSSLFDLFE